MTGNTAPAGNTAQAAYWADSGPSWVRLQERLDTHLEDFGLQAIERLAPVAGEHVLDVGCGCGATALELARRVGSGGAVHGIDLSPAMVERARERAASDGLDGATFDVADAQVVHLAGYDAAFSRFGVMFFADPVAAFANIATALKPAGRLTFVCWQALEKNPWLGIPLEVAAAHVELPAPPPPGAPGPMSLADPDHVRTVLVDAGWQGIEVREWIDDRFIAGTPPEAAAALIEVGPVRRIVEVADTSLVDAITRGVTDALSPHVVDGGVSLKSGVWIVSGTTSE